MTLHDGRSAVDWVAARDADSPPDLRMRVRSAVEREAAAGSVAATLVAAAVTCLGAGLRLGGDRAAAAELLAADALLTWACEAESSEAGGGDFDALLETVVARLEPLHAMPHA